VSEAWRRPRGVTSRMRKEKAGWPQKVKNGFGSAAATRGLHPSKLIERRLERLSDLEGLDPKHHIIRLSARLGERKRLLLLERVRQLNFHIANPGKEEAQPVGTEQETEKRTPSRPHETSPSKTLEAVSAEETSADSSEKGSPETLEETATEPVEEDEGSEDES